jgi:hypothetical protein
LKPTPLEILLGRLVRLGLNPQPIGGGWAANCPDADHGPGHVQRLLSIHEDADGHLVVDCAPAIEVEEQARLRLVQKKDDEKGGGA